MKVKKYYLLLLIMGTIFNCTKRNLTASEELLDYLNMSFKAGQTRESHIEKTTGSLRAEISEMADEDFAQYIEREGINKRRFKIVLNNCNEDKCFITYTLGYNEGVKNNPDATVEVKKIAELWNENGVWKIADVNNVKTHIQNNASIEVSPTE